VAEVTEATINTTAPGTPRKKAAYTA